MLVGEGVLPPLKDGVELVAYSNQVEMGSLLDSGLGWGMILGGGDLVQ